jgi:hypothetical protein
MINSLNACITTHITGFFFRWLHSGPIRGASRRPLGTCLNRCLNFKRSWWWGHLPQQDIFCELCVGIQAKETNSRNTELELSGVFLISPLHCTFLSVCLYQRVQVNKLSRCWYKLRTIRPTVPSMGQDHLVLSPSINSDLAWKLYFLNSYSIFRARG